MQDQDFCFTHNPKTKKAQKLAASKGGRSHRESYSPLPIVELKTTKDVARLLATTINEVRECAVPLRVANCLGYLAGHLIKALEQGDLEARLTKLEQAMPQIKSKL